MKKLGRKIKLNFSQDASKSEFGDKKGFRPLLNAGIYCYSVRVSVIVIICNTQRISYLL